MFQLFILIWEFTIRNENYTFLLSKKIKIQNDKLVYSNYQRSWSRTDILIPIPNFFPLNLFFSVFWTPSYHSLFLKKCLFLREWETERERERTHAGEGQRERGTEDLKGLCADRRETNVGLKFTNLEIMTFAAVGRWTNRVTQAPLSLFQDLI